MAVRFQYNKTSLQEMNKQLRIRKRALPTLKNKEAALRLEVRRSKEEIALLGEKLAGRIAGYNEMARLWPEFNPSLINVKNVEIRAKKVAGVQIPVLGQVNFNTPSFSLFNHPIWFIDGISILKELATIGIEKDFCIRKMKLLDRARKKTTQKVNLYEKIQIPEYEQAILKIKRFLEDEANLSKSAQKIVKKRLEQTEA